MRLSQEAIQRMISGRSGGGGGGSSFDPSALAGYATQAWTEENYISKTFFNELFIVHKKVTTVVMDGETEISRTVTTNSIFAPNEIPGTTTETDEETGYVTTVTTEISSIESKKGFWTNYFISALGLNSEGGGGGLTLNEPLATINVSGLANHPSSSNQTIVWNGTAWVYGTAGGGTGTVTGVKVGDITYSPVNGIVSIPAYPTSLAWSAITGKPTTLAGYGITDAKIENGVITLGSNSITPLTSSDITDMATKTWVGQQGFALASNVYSRTDADAKFMTIAAFENLFNALNSSGQKVSHPYSSGVASIKAMVGLWTEQYLSALGKSDSGGEIVLNEPLASINDAGLAAHPSSSGQTIVWNGNAWTYGTAGGSGMTYTFATGDANGQFKVTPSSGAAYNVNIKGLAALAYKASLAVSDIPDLVPILAVVAAANQGAVITDVRRLRLKESDRIHAIVEMLCALGGRATADENTLTIYPATLTGGTVDACNDHRIAMAAAIASTVCKYPVTILGAECVSKSYPGFWKEFTRLGGKI